MKIHKLKYLYYECLAVTFLNKGKSKIKNKINEKKSNLSSQETCLKQVWIEND